MKEWFEMIYKYILNTITFESSKPIEKNFKYFSYFKICHDMQLYY